MAAGAEESKQQPAYWENNPRSKSTQPTICPDEPPCMEPLSYLLDYAGHVDAVDMCGARLGGEHGEDSGAAANVEHDLVLEEVLVVPHRVAVRQGPNLQSNER